MIGSGGFPSVSPTHRDDDIDASTQQINDLFHDTDATLAAVTDDFNLSVEHLKTHIERELTRSIAMRIDTLTASLKQSFGDSISLFLTNIQQDVDNLTFTLNRDIQ